MIPKTQRCLTRTPCHRKGKLNRLFFSLCFLLWIFVRNKNWESLKIGRWFNSSLWAQGKICRMVSAIQIWNYLGEVLTAIVIAFSCNLVTYFVKWNHQWSKELSLKLYHLCRKCRISILVNPFQITVYHSVYEYNINTHFCYW